MVRAGNIEGKNMVNSSKKKKKKKRYIKRERRKDFFIYKKLYIYSYFMILWQYITRIGYNVLLIITINLERFLFWIWYICRIVLILCYWYYFISILLHRYCMSFSCNINLHLCSIFLAQSIFFFFKIDEYSHNQSLLSFFIKSRMFLLVSEISYFVKHIFIHKSYSINYFWWAKFVLNYNREAIWRLCNTIFAICRINILLQIMYDIIFFIV